MHEQRSDGGKGNSGKSGGDQGHPRPGGNLPVEHAENLTPAPAQTSQNARPAIARLRATVAHPIGAELSWPKQLQSGLRPRMRFAVIPKLKVVSRMPAPTAPHHAVLAESKATTIANSVSGRRRANGPARIVGTPKSRKVWRNLAGSKSFVDSATKNMAPMRRLSPESAIDTAESPPFAARAICAK